MTPRPDRRRDLVRQLAGRFSDCTSYAYEVVAAEVIGDMAYTTGYEHTQGYRREGSEWRVAHRHGDTVTEADGA